MDIKLIVDHCHVHFPILFIPTENQWHLTLAEQYFILGVVLLELIAFLIRNRNIVWVLNLVHNIKPLLFQLYKG